VIMNALGVKLGFGFSAGLIDYVLNYGLATRPLLLIPVGVAYFAIYYLVFSWCIRRFDLKTPGREVDVAPVQAGASAGTRGQRFVEALGGGENLRTVDACTTRLRLTVTAPDRVDEAALKGLGARGVIKLAGGAVQVVLGPMADQVAGDVRAALSSGSAQAIDAGAVAKALGAGNVKGVELRATRLLVEVADAAKVDEAALTRAGVRAVAVTGGGMVHLIAGEDAAGLARGLERSAASLSSG
jgi:N-acetylglucosamine PTS system EIICBA or EIICB component